MMPRQSVWVPVLQSAQTVLEDNSTPGEVGRRRGSPSVCFGSPIELEHYSRDSRPVSFCVGAESPLRDVPFSYRPPSTRDEVEALSRDFLDDLKSYSGKRLELVNRGVIVGGGARLSVPPSCDGWR